VRKTVIMGVLAGICWLMPSIAAANAPSASYFFTADQYVLPVPAPYEPSGAIRPEQNPAIGPLNHPQDLFIDEHDRIYIADTGNHRIVVVDPEGEHSFTIGEPGKSPQEGTLSEPQGVYADKDGNIYVADTGNQRIALFDRTGRFLRDYRKPESPLLGEGFDYRPIKIAVDFRDYMYVVSQGNLKGLMMLDAGGSFRGYFGANQAKVGPLGAIVRMLYGRESRNRAVVNLPYSFNNVTISPAGYLYVTTTGQRNKQVRKLNAVGRDIMPIPDRDYADWTLSGESTRQNFVDATVDAYGNMTVVDQSFGRMYQYDESGRMLFAFGSNGEGKGLFGSPSAIEADSKGNLYVLDQVRNRVHQFRPTPFAELVHKANDLFSQGLYEESLVPWQEVLKRDNYYELALQAIGYANLRQEKYERAMDYFKRAYDKTGYSEAYHEFRRVTFRDRFEAIAGIAAAAVLLLYIALKVGARYKRRKLAAAEGHGRDRVRDRVRDGDRVRDRNRGRVGRRRRLRNGLLYPFALARLSWRIMTHPIQGFAALRYEGLGRVRDGLALMLAYTVVTVAGRLTIHFMFENAPLEYVNWTRFVADCLWPWLLWSVVHYGIATITDGEGRFRDVLTGTAYCFAPLICFMLPLSLLTNILTLREQHFVDLIELVLYAWVGILLFVMIKETHSYDLRPATFIALASATGFLIAIGLLMALYGMALTVIDFATQLLREVMFIAA